MTQPKLQKVADGQYEVQGELTMYSVPSLARDARTMLSRLQGNIRISFSGVERVDSAGLALMIDWMRVAHDGQFTVLFEHLPKQLQRIAKVSELQDLLPIHHA
jgi:phospholipid transport system transporter-binding protein